MHDRDVSLSETRRGGSKRPCFGWLPRRATLNAVLLVASATLGIRQAAADEDLLRVTCRGLFQLSVTEAALQCSESDMLTDPQGGLMSAFSAAEAALSDPRIGVGAAGGGIRDVGYIGREATALILQSVRIIGEWQGRMPLTVTLEIQYGFGGYGEGRMKAALRSSLDGTIRRENLSGFRMRHTELGGATLIDDDSSGDYTLPQPGLYPSRSTLTLSVVQSVPSEQPGVRIRADLQALATPSLGNIEVSTSALVRAQARILLSAPCPVGARSRNGEIAVSLTPWNVDDEGTETQWRC